MAQKEATLAEPVDQAFVDDFAERWLEAWNSQDAEKVLGLMADDIVYDDSAWPDTMRGHGDVRVFLEFTWRAFPDLRFESTDGPFLDPSEPKAAFYWRSFATNSGPIDPPGLAATGKQIEFEGGDFHEYRDGKLVRLCIVFDMARVMRKLGALPDPGTREERLVVGLANLRGKLRRRG
jgi:steroid delta-isomerase-like uncharacterized protein